MTFGSTTFLALAVLSASPPHGGTRPPEVGDIAPALDGLGWIQVDERFAEGEPPAIEALRGRVVVVTTYGYDCDSCIRVGVPLANALRSANDPSELAVIAITGERPEDGDERTLAEAKKLGIAHSIAKAGYHGESTPYLDVDRQSNLTFAYVIGRTGGIVWKGDPSRSTDEYLDAIGKALAAAPAEPLPGSMAPELAQAVAAYVREEYEDAEKEARKLRAKHGEKGSAESARASADAQRLIALVESTRQGLAAALREAATARDPESYQRAHERLERLFPKAGILFRADTNPDETLTSADFVQACQTWSEWFELERARPAAFPARIDKAAARYASELERFLAKHETFPAASRARAWIAAYEAKRSPS